jgi:agmatinase
MLEELDHLFIAPEKTRAKYGFADIPQKISFDEANVIIYGIPLDLTTSFGKGTARGPESIRLASACQIETYIIDEKIDIYDRAQIFDLGDIKIPKVIRKRSEKISKMSTLRYLDDKVPKIVSGLYDAKKLPVLLGGEHTVSYYQIKGLSNRKPVLIHFDAHRDMKRQYNGFKICHTTPFYHLINNGYISGQDLVQIGIRQTDKAENRMAELHGVMTFDAWFVHDRIDDLLKYLQNRTKNKNIYISFDIDVYDMPYVPCTGTPEPFGLNPFQVLQIIKSIHSSANLIGLDIVEVGVKNEDYREGALATQTLYRILARRYALGVARQKTD